MVSKPHLECIEKICDAFMRLSGVKFYSDSQSVHVTMEFYHFGNRMPRPMMNAEIVWLMLIRQAFKTSVSVEPMLDSANIDMLIEDLMPYVSDSIWIGTMNHTGRFGKNANPVLRQAIEKIRRGQTNSIIKAIYQRHKNNPMIKWKAEIKKIVGIPLPKKSGMDM